MDGIPKVDENTFPAEVLASGVPVLVEFTARWCGPCRSLEPVLRRLAAAGDGKFKVATVDIEESPALVSRYGVRGAPTMIVFAGGQEKGRHLGLVRQEKLAEMIDSAG